MKKIIYVLMIVFFYAFITGCSGGHKKNKEEAENIEKGKIVASVKCIKNRTHSYAVYLPSGYDEKKQYPLMICFDPHANGTKPLEILKNEAEKYQYILVGSNVSKNGLPWESVAQHYDILLSDVEERFSVDQTRIYTCGFSGGARVASSVAILKGGIAGVIGCSGGFPQIKQTIKTKFDFYGFAGDADMNYAEMLNLDRVLEKNKFRHQLTIFEGTHDWPPAEKFSDSFLWLELNAMRDKKTKTDDAFVKKHLEEFQSEYISLKKKGDAYEEYLMLKKIVNYFQGLTDTQSFEEQLQRLENNNAVKKAKERADFMLKKELAIQQQYGAKIVSETPAWWRNEINKFNNFLKYAPDPQEKSLIKRVLEYLSLGAYSISTSALAKNKWDEALRYVEIYNIIDPDNTEPEVMLAQLYARKNDKNKALLHLRKAADLGFKEKQRITNDTVFLKLNTEKEFAEVLNIMDNNSKIVSNK